MECFSLAYILSMFRHCVVVDRLSLDFVRRTERVVEVGVDQGGEFGLDKLSKFRF